MKDEKILRLRQLGCFPLMHAYGQSIEKTWILEKNLNEYNSADQQKIIQSANNMLERSNG